ncbi:Uncharacterized protein CK203_099758 [Vitis vinifera]|uniref:Uncharacterized protein n=1 Tax=Vitis vinifera TaxID=29760 RepID=A0A438CYS5_VITVI|nr:Uncharacterized protein CK203_099758 [Vitis vinifera]
MSKKISDFRPISLITSLYKIIAKVLSGRLRGVGRAARLQGFWLAYTLLGSSSGRESQGLWLLGSSVGEDLKKIRWVIPASVAAKIERLQRDFLWSGVGEGKRDHLVSWDIVCNPKAKGGVGFGKISIRNLALLGKWLWRYPRKGSTPWHQVILSIYGSHSNGWDANTIVRWSHRCPWKAIAQVSQEFPSLLVFPSKFVWNSQVPFKVKSFVWLVAHKKDIIARFGEQEAMPREFFTDFVKVAQDEGRHFTLLAARLEELGSFYGALPAHDGLWDSATATSKDLLARLAVEHCVHEARGLDVLPTTISRFRNGGDNKTANLLERVVYPEEITHCAAGVKWFKYLCLRSRNPITDPCSLISLQNEATERETTIVEDEKYVIQKFHATVSTHFRGPLKPPFNEEARKAAGFGPQWYEPLAVKEATQNDQK